MSKSDHKTEIDRGAYERILPKLKSKRARLVLERILQNGSISTFELRSMGYGHPPRAAQDLKEAGVSLRTVYGKHPETGNRMGSYVLDAPAPITVDNFSGRGQLPKNLSDKLHDHYGTCCNMDVYSHSRRALQADHRIPFIVAGDPDGFDPADWQLLCGSHQRRKSFECENCPNCVEKNEAVCVECYWAFPENYTHVATREERRVELVWGGAELTRYEELQALAEQRGTTIAKLIKESLPVL